MLRVIITSDCQVTVKSVKGRDGETYTIIEQEAYFDLGGAFPAQGKLRLIREADAAGVGEYRLGPDQFEVGRYGGLELKRYPKLVASK